MLSAQSVAPVPPDDFPDASVVNINRYDRESIINYYNGDAGILFELGFDTLLVQYIYWPDDKIKAEVFLMKSPEAAFGIYSLMTGNCPVSDTVASFDCLTRFQYQAAYGNYYFNITSESGSEFAVMNYIPVLRSLMKQNPQQQLIPPDPFTLPGFKKANNTMFYINGPTGIGMILFPWQQLFTGVRFTMYGIQVPVPRNSVYFARISFLTPDDQYRFLNQAGLFRNNMPVPSYTDEGGIYYEFQQVDALTLFFLQTQLPGQPYPIRALINQ
jgi:hypothetical protein